MSIDYITVFCDARQYLVESIEPFIETFLTGIWDPHIKFALIRDTTNLINKDLSIRFCNLPKRYLPRVKFRMHDQESMTEVSIQNFYNREISQIFLGSAGIGAELFDFYYRESFDPRSDYIFTARYGHGDEEYYSGSKTPEAEYYIGAITPLSIAYGMALEDGII